ncbi:MAG: aminomethyl-transferring glycine dehydrogenase subunit GcvPA [Elusimicrobiales bacterium]|nr:aminomethyl-transferring glycine dehydrogenase subunit GcvPA [Elusimicrobiales bacterium]
MYTPHTDKDREEMLKAIGVSSFEELLRQIPQELRKSKFNLPPALTEPELAAHAAELAAKNSRLLNFAGGGAYEHYIPAAVRALVSRGEFVTAYTPYQAEASQGTLQAIYEYQSTVCALFEMDASNASLYDGATALAEAVNAALRITGKTKVVLPQALNPQYKRTLQTYFAPNRAVSFAEVSCKTGVLDAAALETAAQDAACVVLANPNYFGCLEDADEVSRIAKAAGALLVAVVNPASLGAVRAPGSYNADIAVAEGQPLGLALGYGGPYLGMFACKKEHLRHIPGRICGITKDLDGKRAFVLTLQAREQHIRREKAASNICSNEALCALTATVYCALLGPAGMRELAELNLEAAHSAADKIAALKGFKIKFGKPYFNEFVVECPGDAAQLRDALLQDGILAGIPLGDMDSSLKNCLLVCATETKTPACLDALAAALRKHANA